MVDKSSKSAGKGLEGSCAGRRDWFRSRIAAEGIELFEGWFAGRAYGSHRHDTYAIGLTQIGVQSFHYRGARQDSTPGKTIVLQPDELHDGQAGSDAGFGYRMLYIEPHLIAEAAAARFGRTVSLPYAGDPVSVNPALKAALLDAFAVDPEPLAIDSLLLHLTKGLYDADRSIAAAPALRHVNGRAVERARQFLAAESDRVVHSEELEAAAGMTRYELARQFRRALGTSPYRYALMRRLDAARLRMTSGESLVEVALGTGFSDQAHFTRHFKAAYGMTPSRYLALRRSN